MGTPLPPNKPGNNCAWCWGVGKEFGDTTTPHVITAQLYSLQPGEFWEQNDELLLLTPHLMIQGGNPCFFGIDDGIFAWSLQYFGATTFFRVNRNADGLPAFRDSIPPACQLSLVNGLRGPVGNVAFDGHAFFSWNPEDL